MAGEARVRFSRKLEKKERRKRDARFFGGTYRLLTVGDVREVHEIGRDVASSSRCRAEARAEDEAKMTIPSSCLSEVKRYGLVLGYGLSWAWAA
jgi:hypothetical protein